MSRELDTLKTKELTSDSLRRIINHYLFLTPLEIRARIEKPDTSAIECIIAVLIAKCLARADYKILGTILDRLIGPVTVGPKGASAGGGSGTDLLTHEAIKALVDEMERGAKND